MNKELENLLEDVLKELQGLVRHLKGTNKAMKESAVTNKQMAAAKKLEIQQLKENIKLRKKNGEAFDDLTNQVEEATDELEKFEDRTRKGGKTFLSKLKDFALGLVMASGKTALAFTDVSKPINSLSDAVAAGIEDIPGLGPVTMAMARDFDTARESFVALAQTGASFNGNLYALTRAAGEAGIPLGEFTDMIATNSETLGKFFGTVQAGTTQFVSLGQNLRTMTERDFAQFGLTLNDTNEFLMTFVEGERLRGNVQTYTNAQLLDHTRNYTKQLVTLSALTGKSVKQLDEQSKAALADSLFQAKLAQMDETSRTNLTAAFGNMTPGVQQLTKELLAFGVGTSRVSMDFEAITNGGLRRAIQDLINNAANPDSIRVFQNAFGQLGQQLTQSGQSFINLGILNGDMAQASSELIQGIRKDVSQGDLNDTFEKLSTSGPKAVNLFSQLARVQAKLQTARLEVTLPLALNTAASFGEMLGDAAKAPDGAIHRFLEAIKGSTDAIRKAFGVEPVGEVKKDGPMANFFKMLDNFFFPEAGKGLFGLPKGEGGPMIDDFSASEVMPFRSGSAGFQDFGTGTPAILHGSEAVVPENTAMGGVIKALENLSISPGANSPTTVAGGNDMTMQALLDSNKRMENALNTLVTIGAMTEKNTKSMNNNVAKMGGSLV